METKRDGNNRRIWSLVLLVFAIIACVVVVPVGTETVPTTGPTTPPTQVAGTSTDGWYEVYFTSPVIPFDNVFTDGIEGNLIDKINAAQVSIDLAVYEFDLENVAQALIMAKQRGVDVRVVYDNEYTDPDPQIQELISAGIPAVPDGRSAFMHNKFIVFDGKCVWTGSFNLSVNAAYRNNENALYFCSNEAAANYTTEFQEMFSGEFGPSSPSDTPFPTFVVDGILIENYFSPEDEAMGKIIAAVNESKMYIHFMAYSFTDNSLGSAMLDKLAQGVGLSGIFETTGANTQYSECNTLLAAGADIFLDGNPRTFHHKVIIIDGKTVIMGSFNFTANANDSNDENLLIIHDTSLANAYELEFQRMKQLSVYPTGTTCKK